MRPTPPTTKSAIRKLIMVFVLIALILIFGDYLLRNSGQHTSIENSSHIPLQRHSAR